MKLYYEEIGTGVPVVLIHGFPFDHTIYLSTAGFLQNSARVIMPDMRGFGVSRSAGAINLTDMAGDLCQLLDRLKIARAIIAGHSMGGYVSLEFGRLFPERTAGLMLVASHPAGDNEEQRKSRQTNIERVKHGETRIYLLEGMLPKLTTYSWVAEKLAEMMVRTPDDTLVGALDTMVRRKSMTEWLKGSGIPLGMICGEEDRIIPMAYAVEMAAKLGADPFVRVPAAGHMVMMENPAMTAEGLQKFIKRLDL